MEVGQVFQRPALVWEHRKKMPKQNPKWMGAAGLGAPPAFPPVRSPSCSPPSPAQEPGLPSLRSQELPPDLKIQTLHLVLVPLKLLFFHPSSKKSPQTRTVMARAAPSPVPGPSPRKSQGEAGVRKPRSFKNKSSGPLAKMVTKGANPATPEKRQKKSLFLCNGAHPKPSHAGCSPQPSERSRGQCVFSLLWCFLLSLLSLLFLRKRYKKSTFWFSKHIFGLPLSQHLFSKKLFLMPSTKSQQLFHGPYLNFSEAATHCPAWCGFWKLMK